MGPKRLNKANLYILAWCLYQTQGLILPVGSLFGQILVIVLLLVSLYNIFVANTRYKLPIYFYGLNTLLIMFSVYGVYLILAGYSRMDYAIQVDQSLYLKQVFISLSPIYSFFVFSKEGLITEKSLLIWFFIFLGLTIGNYFENQRKLLYMAILRGSEAEEFTNNVGYEFLALFPLCMFFYKKPILRYISLTVCIIFLFVTMKRGAIAIGIFCAILFLVNNMKKVSLKKKIGLIFLSATICFIGSLFIEKKLQESVYFQKRIEDTINGNSSGRDRLYERFANYFWNETSPMQFIFGSGANATLKVSDNYAHNDWLEIAVNQGILGGFIYLIYWILFLRVLSSKNYEPHVKLALVILFVIYFLRTIISMSYNDMTVGATLVLGYCLAQEKKNEQIIYCSQTSFKK